MDTVSGRLVLKLRRVLRLCAKLGKRTLNRSGAVLDEGVSQVRSWVPVGIINRTSTSHTRAVR